LVEWRAKNWLPTKWSSQCGGWQLLNNNTTKDLPLLWPLIFLFRKEDHLLQRDFLFVGSWCFVSGSLFFPLPQKKSLPTSITDYSG
jgi:hypothetical protein